MTSETLRSRLARGGTALGTMLFEFNTLGIPRIVAAAGADFVMIDLEHTGWGIEGIRPLLAAGGAQDLEMLVRVQGSARHLISPALDLGARGVMVPMVDDAIEAERVVQAARFAPDGSRGFGLLYPDQLEGGVDAAMRAADEATLVILQIETEAGLDHVEEIAATPGVDVLWVGQFDLSIALGVPGAFDDARVTQAEDRVLAACAAAGHRGRRPGRIRRCRALDARPRVPHDRAGIRHRPVWRGPSFGAPGASRRRRPDLTRGPHRRCRGRNTALVTATPASTIDRTGL